MSLTPGYVRSTRFKLGAQITGATAGETCPPHLVIHELDADEVDFPAMQARNTTPWLMEIIKNFKTRVVTYRVQNYLGTRELLHGVKI